MKLKKFFVISTLVNIIGGLAISEAVAQTAQPSLEAALKLNGNNFVHKITVKFPKGVSLARVKEMVLDSQLMSDVSAWVQKAEYKNSLFELTIGKSVGVSFMSYDVFYTHKFDCKEKATAHSWSLDCGQLTAADPDSVVLMNGHQLVNCTGGKKNGTSCEFEMSGSARNLDITGTVGSEIAYILFVEEANYLAHMSLIASGLASNVEQAKVLMASSQYSRFMQELRIQEPANFKNLPATVIAGETDGLTDHLAMSPGQ